MVSLISLMTGCGHRFSATAPAETKIEQSVPVAIEADLPRVNGISIDGKDGDWGEQGLQLNVLSCDSPTPLSSKDFDVLARLGWTDKGLLVLVEVLDNEFREEARDSEIYKGDSVELFVNTKPEHAGSLQAIVGPGMDPKFPELRYYIWDNRSADLKEKTPPAFEASRIRAAQGYCMEALIPWSNLGIKPEVGEKVAFRLNVNDLDKQGIRKQFTWSGAGNPWHILKLADKQSQPVNIAAWAVYDNLLSTRVNVIATADQSGQTVEVNSFAKGALLKNAVASAELKSDGRIAVASLEFPAPAIGEPAFDELAVTVAQKPADHLPMQSIHKIRLEAVRSAITGRNRRMSDADWKQISFANLVCKSYVLENAALPAIEFSDPEMVRKLVGPFTIETSYYDADFNRLSNADKPGRMGAILKITFENGETFTVNRTLYRLSPDRFLSGTAESEAILLASGQSDKYLADLANDKWWQELQKKLGTAIRYEYAIFLPKDYDADPQKKWPLILYLHGGGGHKDKAYASDAKVLADMRPDVIVVAPSSGGPAWRWPVLADLLEEVTQKYRADLDRIYLTGFSMGGSGTWQTATAMPDRFAAIAPVSGGGAQPDQAARLKSMPIWAFNGEKDMTTTVEQARKMIDALKAVGADVQFTVIPGADHVGSLRLAYRMPEMYDWLLKQSRAPAGPASAPTLRPD